MTMTLQEAHDWLVEVRRRNAVNASLDDLDDHDAEAVIQALDAHIAAMGEPVAWMTKGGRVINVETRERVLANAELGGEFVVAAKAAESYCIPLYTVPPASGDWDTVHGVISSIRLKLERERDAGKASLTEWADQLTAALPESQP